MDSKLMPKLLVALVIVLAILYVFNIINTTGLLTSLNEKIEKQRPANINIISLTDTNCPNCFDLTPLIENLKQSDNIKIEKEETLDISSEKGKQLIQEMGIEKIPTIVVTGETKKEVLGDIWSDGWRKTNKGIFFEQVLPPYRNLNTGNVSGLVNSFVITDSSCDKCFSFSPLINFLGQSGVGFSRSYSWDYKDNEAKNMIKRFGITKFPVLILSDNVKTYPQLSQIWQQLKYSEDDGFLIIEHLSPPYFDSTTNKVVGLIDVIYLKDESCSDCYDVNANKQVLERFEIGISSEKTLDITSEEGKNLIDKYNITKVPIIILSEDAKEYDSLVKAWSQVGSIEDDKTFVMRDPSVLGKYKDL